MNRLAWLERQVGGGRYAVVRKEPLNNKALYQALSGRGLRPEAGKNHPSYAFEFELSEGLYLYVKKKTNLKPLVLPPGCQAMRERLDAIAGLEIDWTPTKNTSYRRFPRLSGASQYGYAANIADEAALEALLGVLVGKPFQESQQQSRSRHMDMPRYPLNQILFGPPGTGKTYATSEMAVMLAEPQWYRELATRALPEHERRQALVNRYGELVTAGRIAFTTFHQSFSYEDFVEGIRAYTENDQIGYRVEDGVFKALAEKASRATTDQSYLGLAAEPRIWKISIGERYETELRQHYIARGEARIGWNKTGNLDLDYDSRSESEKTYWDNLTRKTQTTIGYFYDGIQVGDVLLCLKDKATVQAVGIVTSDYRFEPDDAGFGYSHVRDVNWVLTDIELNILPLNGNTRLVQQTVYPLDRMTWKDILAELPRQDIALPARFSSADKQEDVPNYVLIIDEINRGNIARILGELITLLEPDKREGGADARSVILPYSKRPFSVPANLYVLGTMNTADKSLAQLDLALRRRFSFIEVLPDPELLRGVMVYEVDMAELLATLNARIEVLLDREHLIGHSYFLPLKSLSDETERAKELARIFAKKILPLLQEYFYADWERIGWVLNDLDKAPEDQFVQLKSGNSELAGLFSDRIEEPLTDRRYVINHQAFGRPQAYRQILR